MVKFDHGEYEETRKHGAGAGELTMWRNLALKEYAGRPDEQGR
jgi:hypothetical protein